MHGGRRRVSTNVRRVFGTRNRLEGAGESLVGRLLERCFNFERTKKGLIRLLLLSQDFELRTHELSLCRFLKDELRYFLGVLFSVFCIKFLVDFSSQFGGLGVRSLLWRPSLLNR